MSAPAAKVDEVTLSRRSFLVSSVAGGFVLALPTPLTAQSKTGEIVSLNAWLKIASDDTVTIMVSQAEMGQEVQTTLPAIIAEELDADWELVRREMTPHDPAFGNPKFGHMYTGNAESVRTFWPLLRNMGASAREMLIAAAASKWNLPAGRLRAEKGRVVDDESGQVASYGELAPTAATLPPPDTPRLKDPKDWTLLRRPLGRVDLHDKITGAPIFGIDAELDGMVYGAIKHAPTQNGEVASFDKEPIRTMPGVIDIVQIPGAVVVIADQYWRARKALAEADIVFAPGERDTFSTETLTALYQETMDGDAWSEVFNEHDAPSLISEAIEDTVHRATYWSAWQVHAPMEPMNCIASVTGDRCDVIAPTQGQTMTALRVAEALSIPQANVSVSRTFLGGGFGRRLIADFAVEAALASRAVGRPVKLIWSREEDMRHDHYRPGVLHEITAATDADGFPKAMDQKLVTPTILAPVLPMSPELQWAYPDIDPSTVEGITEEGFQYGVDANRLRLHLLDVPIKTMVWRTTGYGPNVFSIESFVDELAHRAGKDPMDYRRMLLERRGGDIAARGIAVLDMLAQKTNWGRTPSGHSLGVAFSHCFDTLVAQVAEVSMEDDGTLDIHRIVTVLDGGYVLDPDITKANIEGGIVWGLSQALTSEITFEAGEVMQSNYHDFEILSLAETPPTEFYFIDSGAKPGGLGEVGPVATTPALTNAIFAASGRRIRELPLSKHGIHTRYRKQYLQ